MRLSSIFRVYPEYGWMGVVTVMDADAMVKYPRGHTTRIQIEAADAILLNKVVSASELKAIEEKLRQIKCS